MPPKLRGKWALGITPRNFTWVIKDRLAICERPGGYGENHRRVRRQEEIIWLRENHFDLVISNIAAPHNRDAFEELNMPSRHRPLCGADDTDAFLSSLREVYSGSIEVGDIGAVIGAHAGRGTIGVAFFDAE